MCTVLEREYWKNWFLMGYAHNSFGELVQRAGLPLNKSAVASSHFLSATTTPGIRGVFGLGDYHHHHSSRQLKKITIITMTQEGLASAPIAIPAVTEAPVVDVLSGTIAADTITTTTAAAITVGVPQTPKKQKPTDPAEPTFPCQRRS